MNLITKIKNFISKKKEERKRRREAEERRRKHQEQVDKILCTCIVGALTVGVSILVALDNPKSKINSRRR